MKINILRSKLLPLALGLAMIVGVPLAAAKPVGAAWGCASGWLCLYDQIDYQGSQQNLLNPTPGCYNAPPQFNDKFLSVHNYTARYVILYENANCTFSFRLPKQVNPGQSFNNLVTQSWVGHQISSFKVNP